MRVSYADVNPRYVLSSVKNALLILNSFTVKHPEWGIRDLARHLGVTHSTIKRLLTTLASEGYVVQDPDTKKYRLGIRLLAFDNVIKTSMEIHKEGLPVLERLVKTTNETAHISVLEGSELIYMHKVEPQLPIRVFTEIGRRVPCYCVAGGKAILAYQDEKVVEKVIQSGLIPYTKKTITDPDKLRAHLREIAEKGYAISQGEYLPSGEITSVAAPIFDYSGKAIASISLIAITQKLNDEKLKTYTSHVVKAAKEISRRLGY